MSPTDAYSRIASAATYLAKHPEKSSASIAFANRLKDLWQACQQLDDRTVAWTLFQGFAEIGDQFPLAPYTSDMEDAAK